MHDMWSLQGMLFAAMEEFFTEHDEGIPGGQGLGFALPLGQ